jgi:hypothetical protein
LGITNCDQFKCADKLFIIDFSIFSFFAVYYVC